ncbi:hypothetical protein ZWY2020_008341 [Hordeum vulgare]|nr:hypothetical protein ZWY2020_008341 [Hordeum vulgare]
MEDGGSRVQEASWPEDLRVPLERFGPVRDVYLPKDYYTREPRGFAFVEFVDPYDASDAQYHLNRTLFFGREITNVVAAESRKRPDDMRIRERRRNSCYGLDPVHAPTLLSIVAVLGQGQGHTLLLQDGEMITLLPHQDHITHILLGVCQRDMKKTSGDPILLLVEVAVSVMLILMERSESPSPGSQPHPPLGRREVGAAAILGVARTSLLHLLSCPSVQRSGGPMTRGRDNSRRIFPHAVLHLVSVMFSRAEVWSDGAERRPDSMAAA